MALALLGGLAALAVRRGHRAKSAELGSAPRSLPSNDPQAPAVARLNGIVITVGDVEAEMQVLPHALRPGVGGLASFSVMLLHRRLLAAEALRLGERAASKEESSELSEHRLVRALLARAGIRPAHSAAESLDRRWRFDALVLRLSGGAKPQIDTAALTKVRADDAPVPWIPLPLDLQAETAFFANAEDQCVVTIDAGGFYSAACRSGEPLSEVLLFDDVLFLESIAGPHSMGFLHHLPWDGVSSPKVMVAAGTADTSERLAPAAPPGFDVPYTVTLTSVSSEGVEEGDVRTSWERFRRPFTRCWAYFQWINRFLDVEGSIDLRLSVGNGRVTRRQVDILLRRSEYSSFGAGSCAEPWVIYGLQGTGKAVLHFHVKNGEPSRSPPPGPLPVQRPDGRIPTHEVSAPTPGARDLTWGDFMTPLFAVWMPNQFNRRDENQEAPWDYIPLPGHIDRHGKDVIHITKYEGVAGSERMTFMTISHPRDFPLKEEFKIFALAHRVEGARSVDFGPPSWVDGYPSSTYRAIDTSGGTQRDVRIVFTPYETYFATVNHEEGTPLSPDAERFRDSLHIHTDPPELLKQVRGIDFINCPVGMPLPLDTAPRPACAHLPPEALHTTQR